MEKMYALLSCSSHTASILTKWVIMTIRWPFHRPKSIIPTWNINPVSLILGSVQLQIIYFEITKLDLLDWTVVIELTILKWIVSSTWQLSFLLSYFCFSIYLVMTRKCIPPPPKWNGCINCSRSCGKWGGGDRENLNKCNTPVGTWLSEKIYNYNWLFYEEIYFAGHRHKFKENYNTFLRAL